MGGGSYDYDTSYSSRTTDPDAFDSGWDSSLGSRHGSGAVDPALDPNGAVRECCQATPIVVALDVTGSHYREAQIIYNRLPDFFKLLLGKGYVREPGVSFAAVGDATCDSAPLQVGQFETDDRLDEVLSKIRLEGGGGGGLKESYELAAWFYATRSRLTGLPSGKKGYFFFLGDEGFYPQVSQRFIREVLGGDEQAVSAEEAFRLLQELYHVFCVFPSRRLGTVYESCAERWKSILPEQHVLFNDDPNTILDVIMGILAMEEGEADLEDIEVDLGSVGRDALEKESALAALEPYARDRALVKVSSSGNLPKKSSGRSRRTRSQRL